MRFWIYNALDQICNQGTYSNLYLRKHLQELSKKDQGLATQIVYGTIQNISYCRYAYTPFVRKGVSESLDILLCMSVYQLLFLDRVPRYAIINDAVQIAKKIEPKSAGFVNALLRKMNKNSIVLPEDEIERTSVLYSLPVWLLRMWNKQYGKEDMLRFAQASLQTLPTYIRLNPMRIKKAPSNLKHVTGPMYIYEGQGFFTSDWYQNGQISAQDLGSYAISEFVEPQKGERILDCCGAPGTKSMAMAEMCNDEIFIDILDIHAHRVELIKNDCQRLHLKNIVPHVQDATNLSGYGMYDKVLCDVPCSGYGVLARKPDIRLHMQPEDMDTLIPLQQAILESASHHVKEKGTLIYSTCTINKKENEKQIQTFLESHPEFECIDEETVYPDIGFDGFYMAKCIRK